MDNYIINMDEIIASKDAPSFIKDLFRTVSQLGYISPQTYFETLSTPDLDTMRSLVEQMSDENAPEEIQFRAYELIMLMTIGFLIGEGTEITEETVTENSSLVIHMISLEAMARIGLVKPVRSNWSLSGDPDAIWVESIDG